MICYGVYYYVNIFHTPADVRLIFLSTDKDKVKQFVQDNFGNISNWINNSVNMVYKNKWCIGWVSTYEMDEYIFDKGLSCSQPYNNINIIKLLS